MSARYVWSWRIAGLVLVLTGCIIAYLHPTQDAFWGMFALAAVMTGSAWMRT